MSRRFFLTFISSTNCLYVEFFKSVLRLKAQQMPESVMAGLNNSEQFLLRPCQKDLESNMEGLINLMTEGIFCYQVLTREIFLVSFVKPVLPAKSKKEACVDWQVRESKAEPSARAGGTYQDMMT